MNMTSPRHALDDTTRDRLLELIVPLLHRSAFERRARWSQAVVILRPDEQRITSRADFAGWLRANALDALARECVARRVPPGALLVWLEIDSDEAAGVGFLVFDMHAALARHSLNERTTR